MSNVRYVKSKVDYFNIAEGDLCKVIHEDGIFVKVVKIGMTQIHYLYNFEFDDEVGLAIDDIWKESIKPIVFFLSGTSSISAGRSYNDILLLIDGGDLPPPHTFQKRGDLAPTSLMNEVFKLIDDVDVDDKDGLIDSLLDGSMSVFVSNLFIHSFYITNYPTIKHMVDNWASYREVVKTAHKLSIVE